jgi:hypothetical protein
MYAELGLRKKGPVLADFFAELAWRVYSINIRRDIQNRREVTQCRLCFD